MEVAAARQKFIDLYELPIEFYSNILILEHKGAYRCVGDVWTYGGIQTYEGIQTSLSLTPLMPASKVAYPL